MFRHFLRWNESMAMQFNDWIDWAGWLGLEGTMLILLILLRRRCGIGGRIERITGLL